MWFKEELSHVNAKLIHHEEWLRRLEERIEAVAQDLRDAEVNREADTIQVHDSGGADEIIHLKKQKAEIRKLSQQIPKPSLFRQIRQQFQSAEDRRRANNVIVHGLPREGNESRQDSKKIPQDLINHKLGAGVTVEEGFRLGKNANAPLLIKLCSVMDKRAVFKNCFKPKGTPISVQEDISDDTRHERRRQLDNH